VKVAEAQVVEAELQRIREENVELKIRLNEIQALDAAKKKAESRAELLEEKVSDSDVIGCELMKIHTIDGRHDPRAGDGKGKRVKCDL
jgi:hypothetical protein